MKKIMILLFIIMILFFTESVYSDTSPSGNAKEVLKKVSPSIVKVISQNHKRYIATGIAIDRDYVITSMMVTKNHYDYIYIRTVKGKNIKAKVVGKDSKSSILLLRIEEKALTPIKYAKKCEVGDWIALVGAFYKSFPSIFQGILSSISEDEVLLNAPVVPGASGGAVVNRKGELIGLIRGRFGYSSGPDYTFRDHSSEIYVKSTRRKDKDLCLAVPIEKVLRITEDLRKYGKVKRSWLGLSLYSRGSQVWINSVVKGSPAYKAGLLRGDALLKIGDTEIQTSSDVTSKVKRLKPDQKVRVKLIRNKKKMTLTVTMGEAMEGFFPSWPKREDSFVTIPENETLPKMENYVFHLSEARTLGADMMALTSELAKTFKVKEGNGLMIAKIHKDSAAQKAGFRVSDILVRAGTIDLKRVTDLRRVLDRLDDHETITVQVYRKGKIKEIKVVPDKHKGRFGVVFDSFINKMNEINIQINESKTVSPLIRSRIQGIGKGDKNSAKKTTEAELMETYKRELDQMKKSQEKLIKEIKEMQKKLEKKKKDKK